MDNEKKAQEHWYVAVLNFMLDLSMKALWYAYFFAISAHEKKTFLCKLPYLKDDMLISCLFVV